MASKAAIKVAAEVAEAEFDRMCDANRIERDETKLDAEELEEWLAIKARLVAEICSGPLVIDTEGRPVYSPSTGGKAITFSPATGATLMALETHGKGKDVSNMVAAMAEMTGTSKGEFSRMPARDFQLCGRLARLFLADR